MPKTIETSRDWHAYWQLRGNNEDSLTQVGRTIQGQPISSDQVRLLVNAIRRVLRLKKTDLLLDLCCGNGLVTAQLASFCDRIVGVDYSVELLKTARTYYAPPNVVYLYRNAAELLTTDFPNRRPKKICLNGALQYFTSSSVIDLLTNIRDIAGKNSTLLCTDVPDAAMFNVFYNTPERKADLDRRRATGEEAIGTWWSRADLGMLMEKAGFTVTFIEQNSRRHTAHYRFDFLAHSK